MSLASPTPWNHIHLLDVNLQTTSELNYLQYLVRRPTARCSGLVAPEMRETLTAKGKDQLGRLHIHPAGFGHCAQSLCIVS